MRLFFLIFICLFFLSFVNLTGRANCNSAQQLSPTLTSLGTHYSSQSYIPSKSEISAIRQEMDGQGRSKITTLFRSIHDNDLWKILAYNLIYNQFFVIIIYVIKAR